MDNPRSCGSTLCTVPQQVMNDFDEILRISEDERSSEQITQDFGGDPVQDPDIQGSCIVVQQLSTCHVGLFSPHFRRTFETSGRFWFTILCLTTSSSRTSWSQL